MTEPAPGGSFTPTHRVPKGGLATWESPEPTAANGPRLDPRLEVQLLSQRPDGWAHILCSNGWSAWVDGRLLEQATTPARRGAPAAVDPLLLAGAALALLGSVTPWLSLGGRSISSWQLPLSFLLTGRAGLPALKAGPVLLVGLLVGIAYLVLRSPARLVLLVLALVVTVFGVGGLLLGSRTDLPASVGVGVVLTLGAGFLLAGDYALLRAGRGGNARP